MLDTATQLGALWDAPIGVALFDSELRYVRVNAALAEINGVAAEDHVGKTVLEVLPDQNPEVPEQIRRVRDTGVALDVEVDGYTPRDPGALHTWRVSYFPVRSQGRVVGVGATVIDITDRRRTEEALRRSDEHFRYLADAMPQLVWITRPDGYHEYFNRQWYEFTGTTLDDARGDLWSRLLHPDDLARTLRRWQHSLDTGEPYEIEYRFRRARDGAYRWFLGRALPVRDARGTILHWFGTCTDIHDQKRVESELADAKSRVEVILANLPVGVFIADASGRMVEMNDRGRAIWAGARPCAGHEDYAQYRGFWPGTQRQLAAEEWALARAVLRGETVVGELVDIERFDGTRGTILNNAAPFRDAGGNVTGGVVVVLDVTEAQRGEEALRASEARAQDRYAELEQIYRYAPVGLFTFDREYRFRRINERMAQINGFPVEEHIGKSMYEVVPDLADFLREVYRPVLERGEPVLGVEIHGATPKAPGIARDWLGSYFPLKSGAGEVIGLIGAVLEVTERKNAERALRESEDRLRAADRRKDEFLGVLSHELRNPLAPIRNSIDLLQRSDPPTDGSRHALAVIARQTDHLTRLVDDLLDVTRVARGKIELRRARVEIGDLVRRTAEDHRALLSARSLELRVDTPGHPVWVDADATRVAQLVGNLLQNAGKFTPHGGAISVSVRPDHAYAEIGVRDTGMGIDPELLPHVFEPFVQSERSLARTQGGLGLGLALVKGIAELHGGTVTAESAGHGRGAEFILRLPLASSIDRDVSAALEDGAATAALPVNRRVLVVDDNIDAADSLAEVVRMLGHAADVAYDGESALELARSASYDVVLCDIGLPGISGYDVARTLRARGDGVQLFAVSGYAQPEDLARASEAGFDAHVAKPADMARLGRLLG